MRTLSLIVIMLSCICSAEMPPPPNYEELCENSDLIVKANYISCLPRELEIKNYVYSEYTFEVCKIYKGKLKENTISVLVSTKRAVFSNDFYDPKYQNGKTYFLFLQKHEKAIFIKTEIDSIWGDRPFKQKDERLIENEINEQSVPDRWLKKEDNLTYKIPDDANAVEVALSIYQIGKYLKIVKYYKSGELVGERGWYKSGIMAYEQPYKDRLRHGISKGWNEDGSLAEICCYRKDRYHGYALRWMATGNLEIFFCVRGKFVSQKEYQEQYKKNVTLPKFSIQ
jgi:antitoxin component YwqK of YwqJK toxin-antitoxin module